MKIVLLTATLLIFVFGAALRSPQGESDRILAEKLLASQVVRQVPLSGVGSPPAFQEGARAALFFERRGMQGPIRGVVVIEDDRVVDMLILESHEGLEHDALDSPDFLDSFRGKPAKPPLIVDAISGATISLQAVTDAVNTRLAQWVTYTRKETNARP